MLPKTLVIHGDALDVDILAEANVKATETVIAVSNDDEVNILASLLAKRFGCERSVTLINKTTYAPLIGTLGIDAVVNPRTITVSRSEEHTSELQSLMRISYAVFCLKNKKTQKKN